MARHSRRSRKTSKNKKPLLYGGGVLALIVAGMLIFKPGHAGQGSKAGKFSVAEYRRDGSRFASSGNRYVVEGKITGIETHGDHRMLAVAVKGSDKELLPILVPGDVKLAVNLTRGDSFVFDVSCRTGRDEDGNEVRGILVVNNVESK